jgi:hypothetical protein
MKRNKLLLYFTFILILCSCISTHVVISIKESETISFFQNYYKNDQIGININERYSDDEDPINNFLLMDMMPDFVEYNKPSPKLQSMETAAEYNWANFENQDWSTPARSQGYCGSCWVFAANGILESVIEIKENCPSLNPDLSEQYVLSCLPSAGNCQGGWSYWALKYMRNTSHDGNYCNGALLESCFPYEYDDTIPCFEKCNNWQEYLIPIKECGYWVSNGSLIDRESIKNQILLTGPVACGIYATSEFIQWGYNNNLANDYFPYSQIGGGINHVIIILGWKDNEAIGNGGYWICKNSWGTNWGYNGFFNIEYGSLNMESEFSPIVWVDYEPESFDWPPKSKPGGPYCGYINNEIIFNANLSFDPEDEILSYIWDVNGKVSNGMMTSYNFQDPGVYYGTLTVMDTKNQTDETSFKIQIQIKNDPPNKPSIEGPIWGRIFQTYEYSLYASDPDDNDVYYYVNWDDNESIIWEGPYESNEVIVLNHFWIKNDIHTIRVKAKDTFGVESDVTTLDVYMQKGKNIVYKLFGFLEDYPWILSSFIRLLDLLNV